MTTLLHFFVLFPLLGFAISLLIPARQESLISRTVLLTVGLHGLGVLGFIGYWLLHGHPALNQEDIHLFGTADYSFFLDFYFDSISATYLAVGTFLTYLITTYSRYYLHRERGYKRFFNTILAFYLGYTLAVLSGNLETLFIGWELLGVASFLLIAFYRDRYLPVKNAVKVFSIYRIGDVGLLLAMWLSHHLWHANVTFAQLANFELVHHQLETHSLVGVAISLLLLLTAAAKSAQLPFSSWLPRAMEGPTPSTAIFYGALSVHLGVFLLLRTYPFWEHQLSVRVLIGALGVVTAVVTTGIARVQSSVKSQIAYASIAQIGLIFTEVALGFEELALFHFAGNAFLRTYQLLVSPSVVSYLIREQFYDFSPHARTIEDSFPRRLAYSAYILCVKEWNLDSLLHRYLWNPLKWAGGQLSFLSFGRLLGLFVPVYGLGVLSLFNEDRIPASVRAVLPPFFSLLGLILVLKAFTERRRVRTGWVLVLCNHFCVALAISFNERFAEEQVLLYLSGIVVAGVVGLACLNRLKSLEKDLDLDRFQGHSLRYPKLAFVFLMACLAVSGFPITPTFIGEDLIFTHIHEEQVLLAAFTALSFILDALALIRMYARIFLGPPVSTSAEVAYRSS